MIKSIQKLFVPISILIILTFVLFVANQVSGLYLMVQSHSQQGANLLLGFFTLVILVLLSWPVLLYLKLPTPLKLPASEQELTAYRNQLFQRLKSNDFLLAQGQPPASELEIGQSLGLLDDAASKIIYETATAVFLTTSVSQNGKLDALTILVTQSRMVWKVAHLYYQRPGLREIMYLYANVAGASFLASEIEDLDISQQMEPVISSFLKSTAGKSIPVIGPTAHLILDSLLEGSTNAFLTLRVGHFAKKYCGCNEVTDKPKLKKEAFYHATKELKTIILESSGRIISGLAKATRKAGVDTIRSGWEGVKSASSKVAEGISEAGKKVNPFANS